VFHQKRVGLTWSMGGRTISDKEGMIVAGQEANRNQKPVIFDPVAVGATSYRRETAKGESHWSDLRSQTACVLITFCTAAPQNYWMLGSLR
jgi:hypothetical protein